MFRRKGFHDDIPKVMKCTRTPLVYSVLLQVCNNNITKVVDNCSESSVMFKCYQTRKNKISCHNLEKLK